VSAYTSEVKLEKKYIGNVVIQIASNYFAIRQPDSGLVISSPYDKCVSSLLLNPTQIDLRKVTTTISTFSFRLLDKDGIITALVLGDAAALIGQEVRIFLGRSETGMSFSEYYELPRTDIKKCDHSDNTYNFSTSEKTERMAKPIYDKKSALSVDILIGTTIWTMRDSLATFPSSGFLKVDNEFVSYSGVDLVLNRFTGVIRGELNSTPAVHSANADTSLVETVTDNPLNIILKILISGGGGGAYDTLQSGLGISNALIDIAGIEALRDDLFIGVSYTLSIYDVDSALKFLEDELLMPNNLRFTNSLSSKVTLAILDKARFVEEDDIIDENTMTKYPKWSIDGAKVTNVLVVNWGFNEGTGKYEKRDRKTDAASILTYREQTALTFNFKGIKSAAGGQALVDDFSDRLLARLSTPSPDVSINTHIDKSLQNVGDKAYLVSSQIPAADGTLNFASNLEITSRSINLTNGDVSLKLAFTSFTNIRSGFIAPSDSVFGITSQKIITLAAGRGAYYLAGWQIRLWDNVSQVYLADAINTIESVSADVITFQNNWTTTLATGNHRIRFADYDDVIESQRRYCFLSANGANFTFDNKPTYKVTY